MFDILMLSYNVFKSKIYLENIHFLGGRYSLLFFFLEITLEANLKRIGRLRSIAQTHYLLLILIPV